MMVELLMFGFIVQFATFLPYIFIYKKKGWQWLVKMYVLWNIIFPFFIYSIVGSFGLLND